MTAPQERPVAGDGLDREAVRRRAERAAATVAWSESAADGRTPGRFTRHYAADVSALLDALEAAEAEVRRLRASIIVPVQVFKRFIAHASRDENKMATRLLSMDGVLHPTPRTEGGAS